MQSSSWKEGLPTVSSVAASVSPGNALDFPIHTAGSHLDTRGWWPCACPPQECKRILGSHAGLGPRARAVLTAQGQLLLAVKPHRPAFVLGDLFVSRLWAGIHPHVPLSAESQCSQHWKDLEGVYHLRSSSLSSPCFPSLQVPRSLGLKVLKQKGIPLSVLCPMPAPGLAWAAGRQGFVNREGLSIPMNMGMGPSQWAGGSVRSCQMFAERWATCRASPSVRPVLAATASFLLGPKLFEDIFTHLLLLAKVRGGSHREMTEGRTENVLGRSVPGVGTQAPQPYRRASQPSTAANGQV